MADDLQWAARPLQPQRSTAEGVIWTFLASAPPDQECIQIEGKLVTIAQQEEPTRPAPAIPRLIAPRATHQFLAQAQPKGLPDPVWTNDPWAKARAHTPAPVASALTALATAAAAPPADDRVKKLEGRMAQLEQSHHLQENRLTQVQTQVTQLDQKVDQGFQTMEHNLGSQLSQLQQSMTTTVSEQIARQLGEFRNLLQSHAAPTATS